MAIVMDANLLTVLISGDLRGEQVLTQIEAWIAQEIPLHAPDLAQYEIANALTRLIVAGAFDASAIETAWQQIQILPVTYHALTNLPRVIEIARSSRQNAYDASYIALAELLEAELWTLDSPLYRNAVEGFSVRLINSSS